MFALLLTHYTPTPFFGTKIHLCNGDTVLRVCAYCHAFVGAGFDGTLSAHLTAGMAPSPNTLSGILEFFACGLLRLISLGYLKHYNNIVEKVYREEGLIR